MVLVAVMVSLPAKALTQVLVSANAKVSAPAVAGAVPPATKVPLLGVVAIIEKLSKA